jgi:hypothetical protein
MSKQRRLVLFPVVHTLKDLGGLAEVVAQARPTPHEKQRFAEAVAGVWDRIEHAVDALPVAATWRIYQDGLPICRHEQAIVADLAAGGSRNHRLVQRLMQRGAVLMGTESAELLVEEYQLQKELLEQGADMPAAEADENRRLAAEILVRRDRFIAERINATLAPGDTGVLFLGLVHDLEPHLDADIEVTYPIGSATRRGV